MFITIEWDNNLCLLASFLSPIRCVRSFHMSLVSISSFSSRKQFTLSSYSSRVLFFLSFIPLILKLFLLERSSRSTSLFLISIAQLGLEVWMNPMSFLRMTWFLSIVDIVSFIFLNFSSVYSSVNSRLSLSLTISLLRLSSLWFVSVVFSDVNCIMQAIFMTSDHFPLLFRDSFLMLFEHILGNLLDIANDNIGWSHDKFPWIDDWLLIRWLFDDSLLNLSYLIAFNLCLMYKERNTSVINNWISYRHHIISASNPADILSRGYLISLIFLMYLIFLVFWT